MPPQLSNTDKPVGGLRSTSPGKPLILPAPTEPPGPWVIERVFTRYRSFEVLVGGLGLVAVALPGHWLELSSGYVLAVLITLAVTALLLELVARVEVRRIEKSAMECDNNLCLICGYCLKHLPEKHICPECGTHYDLDHVVAEWQTYLSSRRKNR